MTHTIDLTDEQARSAAEGTLTEIRVPIEGLPNAPIIDVYESALAGIRFFCVDYVGGLDRFNTPYAIGDTLLVKWREQDTAMSDEWTVTGVEVENLVTKCTEHTNFPFCVVNDHAEGELIKKWYWMIALETKP